MVAETFSITFERRRTLLNKEQERCDRGSKLERGLKETRQPFAKVAAEAFQDEVNKMRMTKGQTVGVQVPRLRKRLTKCGILSFEDECQSTSLSEWLTRLFDGPRVERSAETKKRRSWKLRTIRRIAFCAYKSALLCFCWHPPLFLFGTLLLCFFLAPSSCVFFWHPSCVLIVGTLLCVFSLAHFCVFFLAPSCACVCFIFCTLVCAFAPLPT